MYTTLFPYIAAARQTIIDWQTELTKRPALGPDNNGQGEYEKAQWLLHELQTMGITEISSINCPDSRVPCGYRPNILAKIPGKSPVTLWIIGHMDVVPVGEQSLWKTDPFTATVEGDYIIGRGVEDNQQAIVTGMLAAKALLDNNITPELTLGLMFVSDEETGMQYGLPHILRAQPDVFGSDDMVLVADMGNANGSMIEIAEKSCLWLKFTVTGKQCHASTPQNGINSLVMSSSCILALQELYHRFHKKDPLFSPSWSTFVPTKKEANVENINTLPGQDIFYLDCRILPAYKLNDVVQECQRIADEVAQQLQGSITVEVAHKAEAMHATSPTSPVVTSLSTALTTHRNITPVLQGSGGQTVAVFLRNHNIEAAAWSTLLPNPHTPNEKSSIPNTIVDAQTVTAMLFPSLHTTPTA